MTAKRAVALSAEPKLWEPTVEGWRTACAEALEKRLGWLKRELELVGGALTALKEREQKLWRWRESAVSEYNRISKLRDPARQISAYRKLWIELS